MEAIEHISVYFNIGCSVSLDGLFFSHSSPIQTLSSHPVMSVCTVRTHSSSRMFSTQLSFKPTLFL